MALKQFDDNAFSPDIEGQCTRTNQHLRRATLNQINCRLGENSSGQITPCIYNRGQKTSRQWLLLQRCCVLMVSPHRDSTSALRKNTSGTVASSPFTEAPNSRSLEWELYKSS